MKTAAEKNLEAFKDGVYRALDNAGIEPDEYTSMFWGNVYGDEFSDENDAFECGIGIVENHIAEEAEEAE